MTPEERAQILDSEGAIVREEVRRGGLLAFIREFWPAVEPSVPFLENWHHGAIAEHLEAVRLRQIRDLVINVPPGTGKSLTCSVFWPAYVWAIQPEEKFICASYDISLVLRDADKCRTILQSDTYRAAFPRAALKDDNQGTGEYSTQASGLRLSTSVQGRGIGWHANTLIVDDPHKPLATQGATMAALDQAWNWFTGTMSTRRASGKPFARVVIMQRLHEMDLAGRALAEQDFEHLCLPMEYKATATWDRGSSITKARKVDPRKIEGEPLWPERYPPEEISILKRALSAPSVIAAQLDQNPTSEEGGIVKKTYVHHWHELPAKGVYVQSWDLGVNGKTETHSRVHGSLWFVSNRVAYLVDQRLGPMLDYVETKALYRATQKDPLWASAQVVLIEEKANGAPMLSDMKQEDRRMIAVNPKVSKADRLRIHVSRFETGAVLFPTKARAPWIVGFLHVLTSFPSGAHDDEVDTTTQLLDRVFPPVVRSARGSTKALENATRHT